MSTEWIMEVLDRAHTGPIFDEKTWNMEIIVKKTREVLKKHGLEGAYDGQNPVSTDDSLADKFFKAGIELATNTGLWCQDTERVVEVSKEEIEKALNDAPDQMDVGLGADVRTRKARKPGEKSSPLFCAAVGDPTSEENYIKLTKAIVEEQLVDMISGLTPYTILGKEIRGGTPYEVVAGYIEGAWKKQALEEAGRPGLATTGVELSPTSLGFMGGWGVGSFDIKKDVGLILSPPELRTTYDSLNMMAFAQCSGMKTRGGSTTLLGGLAGGPEGTALLSITNNILQYSVHGILSGGGSIYDLRYNGNAGRESLWAISVIGNALSRNSHLMIGALIEEVAGPGTRMFFYEAAAGLINSTVSGYSGVLAPHAQGGAKMDHLTPLECRFCGEILKASAKLTRREANEIVLKLLEKYEENLFSPPAPSSLKDLYFVDTMEPKPEWVGLYSDVKEELSLMGLEF